MSELVAPPWLPRAAAFDRRHPEFADAALALAVALAAFAWTAHHLAGDGRAWAFDVALTLPLVWRRRWPEAVFAVLAAVALVEWLTSPPLLATAALPLALLSVAFERPLRRALTAAAVLEVGAVMASVKWVLADSWVRSLVGLTAVVAASFLLGVALQYRRDRLRQLTERAARLELERDQQARLAAAAERARIAREMHDVIAHSLAVMVTMADGAAAKLATDPSRAATAIASISDVGRQALADTRRLVGVLRSDSAVEMAPQPGLSSLASIVEQTRATGINASLSYAGEAFELSPAAELTVYRVVQEATTNTLKHAVGATRLQVEVEFDRPRVRVTVTDDGRPAPTAAASGGHGLAGMRERVALFGGSVRAGFQPGGGWRTAASLVIRGVP